MAEGDGLDELEYKALQGTVSRIEALLVYSGPGECTLYENFLKNARTRLDFLERKIKDQKEEKASQERTQVATAVSLAQRETAFSEAEKKTYGGFLAEEFFTKKDFSRLEQFYTQTWERLSEGGKAEMSHRIWEGIRRDEYQFTDLPKVVQEKEAKLAYSELTSTSINHGSLTRIPEADRNEFIEAYRSGDRKKAFHVLDRDGFRRNMALETSMGTRHEVADAGKAVDDNNAVVNQNKRATPQPTKSIEGPTEPVPIADINLDAVKLKDVKLATADSAPSVASLPNAAGPRVGGR